VLDFADSVGGYQDPALYGQDQAEGRDLMGRKVASKSVGPDNFDPTYYNLHRLLPNQFHSRRSRDCREQPGSVPAKL
jgi:hypothetical protein